MKQIMDVAVKAAIEASKEVLRLYNEGFSVSFKEDRSPVTTGDLKANEIITTYLKGTSIPVLSEESEKESEEIRSSWQKYWCIDPIDGTKEYVNKTGEYCISIGLLTPETSLLGVLAAPSLGLFYFAAEGLGSFKWEGKYEELYDLSDKENLTDELLKNSVKLPLKPESESYAFLTSRSHFNKKDEEYYQGLKKKYPEITLLQMGSAIKIGLVAEGKANEYARLSSVNFWDIAGGHAIAKYAGLEITDYVTKKAINYKDISTLLISGYIIKNI
ncbi:MAG: 3'(2'),5'-bisphosphate nucleotidase CysQ [Flavobacteriaceae bacterium]|jgi:3'(2'), 5'-bisphosphate nucleotidase|nr:3'(2'),5'-bisphosphate nucleotidase CysQ [Flavobacteriaceae bacterium]